MGYSVRALVSALVLATGCGAYNPYAASIERAIVRDGTHCNDTRCYSVDERLELYRNQRIWTRGEKALAAAAVACQAGDAATTIVILDDGGTEQNPLLPNIGVMLAVKAVMTPMVLMVADAKPYSRKSLLIGFDVISCGVLGYNMSQLD
jgi:hypothetical protein